MDIDVVAPSYTILRIKRKRNEEPLDALVVESRRKKKSRGGAAGLGVGAGVFQFAQTVENDAWDDERKKRDIEDQVSRLAAAEATTPAVAAQSKALPRGPPSPTVAKEDTQRRYKVIMQEQPERPLKRRFPSSPPKVLSAKDLEAAKPKDTGFTLYDAVLSGDKSASMGNDDELDKFLPMLSDYLNINDITVPSDLSSSTSSDDYVWDVFYHRAATLSEWNAAANVGTLTGLPPSVTDPYDSASDSEEEDEADEDSNAEEYYKNDYPDEEDSSEEERSSDDFYDDSDDGIYEANDSDHEWR
ncbi:hypothetical protein MIND_00880400 [Mycena indigotica]|uniref:Probable RNA polymerase II nuclear localization protein SLC7A6OS n=1 Tax=Mycena indigotica TaxID=2126181 RepID=A0A8H6SH79_9AGAR|nr:uncharacterized protein MIND_00880400 [Mycena indigotica]KAF7299314.1 hypothetical protein MIND_00880400 [Mycena indigotica]